jgi:hypothetical protein
LNFEVELTGFMPCEIDIVLEDEQQSATTGRDTEEDILPLSDQPPIVRLGEVWRLGRHRLICGDARERPVMTLRALRVGSCDAAIRRESEANRTHQGPW